MGCQQNILNGQELKVNTAAHAWPRRPGSGRAAEIGSALAAVLTFSPRPYNRFCGQPILMKIKFSQVNMLIQAIIREIYYVSDRWNSISNH